ncbi:MAG: hypothetical protein J2P28_01180 [Actinobacteria bacterium]|nr:hypothetical protein [Actinomycetota bacterium]
MALAITGVVRLDLRHARFSQSEAPIRAYALMGGVEIIVPEDIEVDVAGIGFMDGFGSPRQRSWHSGCPRLKVIGFAMMGGVDVQRKPVEKATNQGQSMRAEEKQLPHLKGDLLSCRPRHAGRQPLGRSVREIPSTASEPGPNLC